MFITRLMSDAIKMTLLIGAGLYCQTVVAKDCPASFHHLPVPGKINTCTLFEENFPVVLTFFTPKSPEQIKSFYQNAEIGIAKSRQDLGRFVFIGPEDQYRIIISKDSSGSQVDLLVNQPTK